MKHLRFGPLFLFLLMTPMRAAADEPSPAPVFLPGGVADPEGKTGFVTNPAGGIDAIDLANGKLLWTTNDASRPLAATAGRLLAQAAVKDRPNSVRIVVLDSADKGKQVLASDPVVFPDWVVLGQAYGRSFASSARVDKGALLLKWEAHAFYAGGAPPPPEVVAAARKDASGVARIDLKTGRVQMLPAGKDSEGGPKLPAALAKAASQQYWTGSTWETKPLIVGNTVAALVLDKSDRGEQKLSLKTWDLASGEARPMVELLRGKELWPQVQPDGRYLFVHQALVKEALPAGDYAWWVFALDTGKQVGKVPFEGSVQTMAVIGPRLYTIVAGPARVPGGPAFGATQPRSLRAVDLKTGERLWERPIEGVRRLPPLP